MARPGGNPDLVTHQFSTDRDEPLSEKITIRISPSMLKYLKGMDNYREYCREAIATRIEQDCKSSS